MIDGPNGVMMGLRQQSPHEAAPVKTSSPAPTPAPSAQEVSAAYQVVTKNLTGKTLDARNLAAAAAQARRYAMLHEQAIAEAELEVIAQYNAQHAKAGTDQSASAIERAARQLSASSAVDANTLASAQQALEAGDLHVVADKTVESFNGAICSKTEPDPPPIVLKNEGKTPSLADATDRLNGYLGSGMSLQEAVGILRVENGATPAAEDVLARAALATQAPSYVSAYAKAPDGPDPVGLASAHLAKFGVFDADTLARATKAMTTALPTVTLDSSAARKAADKVAHDKPGSAQFASDMQVYRSALSAEIAQAAGKQGTSWFNDPANIDAWLKSEVAVAGVNLEPLAQAAAGTSDHSPEQKALDDRQHLMNLALEETRVVADIEHADAGPDASRTQIDLARSQRLTSDFSALGLVHFDDKTQQWVHNGSSKANPDASTMLADLLDDTSVQALKQDDIDDALRHMGSAQAESSDRAKADLRATSNALAPFKQGGTTLFYGDMLDAVKRSPVLHQRFDHIASSVTSNNNVNYVHDVAQTLQDVAMPADEDLTRALYQQKFRGRFEDFVAHGNWRAPSGISSLWQSLDAPKYYVDTSNVYAALGDGAQAAAQTEQGASLMQIVKTRMDGSDFVGRTYEGSLTKDGPDEHIKSFYLNWKDKHEVWSGNPQLLQDIAQAAPHSDTTRFIEAELPIAVDARASSPASAPAYEPPDATQTPSGTQVIVSHTQLVNALGDAYQAKQLAHPGKDGARYTGSEKVYGNTTLDDLAKSALASQNAHEPSVDVPLELTMLPLMYWRQDQDPNKDNPESLKLLQVDGINGRRYVGPANTQSFSSYSDWTRESGFSAGMMLSTQHLLQTADGQSQLWDQTLTGQKKLSNGEILLQAGEAMAGIGAMAVVSFVSPEAEGVMMPLMYDGAQLYFAATGVKAAIDAADRIAHDPTSVSAWAEGGWEVAANSFTALSIASHFGMGRLPQLLTRAFEAGQAANGGEKALSVPARLLVSAADNQVGAKTYMALAGAPDAVLTSQRVLLKGAALTNGVLFGAQGAQMAIAWAQGQQVSPAAVMQLVATIGMGQFGRLYHVQYSARPTAMNARDSDYMHSEAQDPDAHLKAASGYEPAQAALTSLTSDRVDGIVPVDGERALRITLDSGANLRARLLGGRGSAPPSDVADLLLPGEEAKGQRYALMGDADEFVVMPRIRGGATDKDPEQDSAVSAGDTEPPQTGRQVGLPKRRLSREEEDFVAELETTAVTDDVIELGHESDPSVFVHIAVEGATGAVGAGPLDAATVRVMSLYRGGLPKGSGHRLLMRTLERYGVRPTERLIFEYVEHRETVQAKADGIPAEDTPLARTGMRTLRALGLTPSSAHYADNRWNHWDLVIELDPHAGVASFASAEQPQVGAETQALSGRPLREVALGEDERTMTLTDTDGHSVTAVLLSGRAAPPTHPDDILLPNGEKRGQRFELVRDPHDGALVLVPRVRGGAVDEDPETAGQPSAPVNAMLALQAGVITPARYDALLKDMRASLHRPGSMMPARSESVDALRIRIERLLEDEARTRTTRGDMGKRGTVEGEGAEHDARVRSIVNTALLVARASVTNGELLRTPLIQTHANALDFIIGVRTLNVRNSQSLALRDADHYLSNLVQEWQLPLDRQTAGQYRAPSAPLARLSGLVSRVYDLTKARQPRAGSGEGVPSNADLSNVEPRDIAPSPPGGRAWSALGTRHFLRMRKNAGSPDHHWLLTETPGGSRGNGPAIENAEIRPDDPDGGGQRAQSDAATQRTDAATASTSISLTSGSGGIQRLTRPKAKPGEQDRLLYSGLPVEEDPAAMLYVPRAHAAKATGVNASPERADDARNSRATRDPIAQSPERTGPFQTGYPAKKSEYPLPQWMATYVPETGLIRTEARKGDVQWVPRRYTERREETKVVTIAPDIHVVSAFGTREAAFDLEGRPVATIADLRRRVLTPQRLANRLSENFGLDERAYTPGQPIALLAEHTAEGGRASFAQQLANEVHAPVYGLVGSYEDREWMLHFPDAVSHPVWQPDMTGRRWSPDGGQPVRVKWNLLERRDTSDLEVHTDDNPIKIDSYLAPQGMFVVNGHTRELLARGPAEVAASARAAGHASDQPVLVLTTDADAQRHAFARQLADELQSPVLILTDDAWALEGGSVVKNTVTVSRVEGAQNRRMTIDDAGSVTFLDTGENRAATVWLNFGPLERTQAYFEQKHGTMDDVVVHSFEVPRSVLDDIRRNAVHQRAAQEPGNEGKPVLGDWLASPDQFGVRWPDAVRLQGEAIRGTGKTTVFEPRPRGPDGATSRRRSKHRADGTSESITADAAPARIEGGASLIHPRKGEAGEDVVIASPTQPSHGSTWADPTATAVFVPDGEHPAALNGIALTQWEAPTTLEGWQNVAGQNPNIDERIGDQRVKKAGTVIVEPDGRVWIIESTNHFTGARSFPKGTVDDGLSLQATAIKETYEETGLHVEIVGHLTDFRQNTGKPKTRYYLARRTGGTPTAMGWETQGVYLVPASELGNTLKTARDLHVLRALLRSGPL
ncbi:NUDIX hydrolase [Trinickia sp.]|uniref:NUDIX hydrolase n=1 Tax=Trinickia sp. TaxID=2571163 RepID=UPI003F8061BD